MEILSQKKVRLIMLSAFCILESELLKLFRKLAANRILKKNRVHQSVHEKDLILKRKFKIKQELRNQLAIIVDEPRNGGFGTTTTGNVAKIPFQNSAITAQICGLPESLVKNLSVSWGILPCGFQILTNLTNFAKLLKTSTLIL